MNAAVLTKSGFLDYLECPKSFWLATHRPERLVPRSVSAFDRMLARDGYAVEALARIHLDGLHGYGQVDYQRTFETGGLHARADAVVRRDGGDIELIEIKSSSGVRSGSRDHRLDAAFQVCVAEGAGHRVSRVHILHVDANYERSGDVVPEQALALADVTADVRGLLAQVARDMDAALDLLKSDVIDERGCGCRHHGSVDRRCAGFAHLNPDVPKLSAHMLPRISRARLMALDDEGRLAIADVTEDDVTEAQLPALRAARSGRPVVDIGAIRAFCGDVAFPVAYYDYEAFGSAIPIADGMSPHAQIPFQFSLHVEDADGTVTHREFLADEPGRHGELVHALAGALPPIGSVISWNAPYEKACNRRLATLLPDHARFLADVDARTIDLMLPFRSGYVDPGFNGSTSIKKVLPVLCPDLSYADFDIRDGAAAMEAWLAMIGESVPERRRKRADALRRYCGMDSWAMVRVMRFLREVVG